MLDEQLRYVLEYAAFRNVIHGSYFIQVFCEVMRERAHQDHFLDIIPQVIDTSLLSLCFISGVPKSRWSIYACMRLPYTNESVGVGEVPRCRFVVVDGDLVSEMTHNMLIANAQNVFHQALCTLSTSF